MVGADVWAVPVEYQNHAAFVDIIPVLPVGTSGIEGENVIVGSGQVTETEQIMVGVGYRIPYFPAFGTLQPDTYSGPVEVYFVYPDQLVFPDGTEVQTTVLHIGTGETGLGPVKGQAIAGVENTFQAVV